MSAGVRERSERAVLGSHDDDGLAADGYGAVVAGICDSCSRPSEHPIAPEQLCHLELEEPLVAKGLVGQGPSEIRWGVRRLAEVFLEVWIKDRFSQWCRCRCHPNLATSGLILSDETL